MSAGCASRDGGGTFTDSGANVPNQAYGSLAIGDFDNDGDLDLALAGEQPPATQVFRNNCAAINTAPTAPSGLSTSVSGNDVTFSWGSATDAETAQPALTYNLRVGTAANDDDVMPAMADLSTGRRRIPVMGNVQLNRSWTLTLPSGTYKWSVQAVDAGFMGGPWATEETVTVP